MEEKKLRNLADKNHVLWFEVGWNFFNNYAHKTAKMARI